MDLVNHSSGEMVLSNSSGLIVRLPRDKANRLIMSARMGTVAEFVSKLPNLIEDPQLVAELLSTFEKETNSSARWALKEKFARLTTLAKGYTPKEPTVELERVSL